MRLLKIGFNVTQFGPSWLPSGRSPLERSKFSRSENPQCSSFPIRETNSNSQSGTGGNRTHIIRFKRPMHYLVCHDPVQLSGTGFKLPDGDAQTTGKLQTETRLSRRGRNRTFDRRLIRTLLKPLSCTPNKVAVGKTPLQPGSSPMIKW